jgi:hypothetical protein
MLSSGAWWDIIYEHFTYFSAAALTALFQSAGPGGTRCGVSFHGQYLSLEGGRAVSGPPPAPPDIQLLARFGSLRADIDATLAEWDGRIRELASAGPIAVWGAGSKGVTFLNLLQAPESIQRVVDINPRKWGKYVPGTGHQVVSPQELSGLEVATVLVMNDAYCDEVREQVKGLGLCAQTLSVGSGTGAIRPPSPTVLSH